MLLTAEQNFDLGTRNGIWITYAKSSTKWKKLITFSKDMAVVIYNTPVRDCLNRSELRNSVKDSPSLTVRTVSVDVKQHWTVGLWARSQIEITVDWTCINGLRKESDCWERQTETDRQTDRGTRQTETGTDSSGHWMNKVIILFQSFPPICAVHQKDWQRHTLGKGY